MQEHDIVKRFKQLEDRLDLLTKEVQWLRYERSQQQQITNAVSTTKLNTKYTCPVCQQNTVRGLVCSQYDCPYKITAIAI